MSNKVTHYFAKALLATFLVLASFVLAPQMGWANTASGDNSIAVEGTMKQLSSQRHQEKNKSFLIPDSLDF